MHRSNAQTKTGTKEKETKTKEKETKTGQAPGWAFRSRSTRLSSGGGVFLCRRSAQ